jgi:hypothetical protein
MRGRTTTNGERQMVRTRTRILLLAVLVAVLLVAGLAAPAHAVLG